MLPPAALTCGVLNLPQGVALVTTRSGQTPPASKFVLGFPGFRRQSLEQLWIGHVFFRFGISGLQELVEAEEFAAEGAGARFAPLGNSLRGLFFVFLRADCEVVTITI